MFENSNKFSRIWAWLELRIPPLGVLSFAAVGCIILRRKMPAADFWFYGHVHISLALICGGILMALAALTEFRRKKTTSNPFCPVRASSVVSTGIYGWTRNPMYLGMAVGLAGIACWRPNAIAFLVIPFFSAYLREFQIKPEERQLSELFGEHYHAYVNSVRRWI